MQTMGGLICIQIMLSSIYWLVWKQAVIVFDSVRHQQKADSSPTGLTKRSKIIHALYR